MVRLLVACGAVALREYTPPEPLLGVEGEVFVLPRAANASSGAASLAGTIEKVAAAYPGFEFFWVDTELHKQWVEEELDVPEEYLPLLLGRTRATPEARYWYDEFPFARGIKDWLEALKAGEKEPLLWLTSAEPRTGTPVVDVTASNFAETVGGEKPTLLAIVSEWCEHCKALKPVLHELAEQNKQITVGSFVFTNNSYCGYEPKPGAPLEKGGVDASGEGVPGLGMKQLEKVCWPARLPLKRFKAFKWRSVPTIFSVQGSTAVKYDGPRSVAALNAFLQSRHDEL
jgi:thiol-disulfide isomerase/thioredoxin